MSDSYDDYEAKIQLAEYAWEKRVVKTEHDKQIKIAQAYERGWNAALAPLYTAPPKKEWVGLTDEEIYDCEEEVGMPQYEISSADLYAFARAIEAKLKEKNHD